EGGFRPSLVSCIEQRYRGGEQRGEARPGERETEPKNARSEEQKQRDRCQMDGENGITEKKNKRRQKEEQTGGFCVPVVNVNPPAICQLSGEFGEYGVVPAVAGQVTGCQQVIEMANRGRDDDDAQDD